MSQNRLSGELPSQLFTLQYLENIDLSNNQYTGNIDTRYHLLPSLEILRLSGNNHTGAINLQFAQMPNLRTLDLSGNNLTEGIPPAIAELTGLRYLNLSMNPNLGGEIPSSITTMSNLQILAIWGSGLLGSIPANIGNISGLMHLDLGNNRLSGEIPISIGDLTELRELTISFNQITGTIPDIFQNMERLLRVHIDRNYLRGHIPASLFARFQNNTIVTFAWNYLTGSNALAIETARGVSVSNGNFIDGSQGQQFRLTAIQNYIQVSTATYTNLFPFLRNIVATGSTTEPKPMRPYYEYRMFLVNPADGSRVSLNMVGGLNVRLTEEVSRANAISLVIKILDNTGSEFSRVTFGIGTEAGAGPPVHPLPPPGGGGGVGGDDRVVIPEVEVPLAWVCHPYIHGYPDGTVRPDRNISREEAAVILFRIIEGFISPGRAASAPFIDVDRDRWSSGYIEFTRNEGLLRGYPDGTFRPAEGMSRNEFAVLLVNLTGRDLITERPENFNLTDVPDNWAAPYIFTVFEAGYITGFPDRTFRGTNLVTRAEAARMLNGAMGRTPVPAQWTDDGLNPYTDLTRSHWAFYEILEASIIHEHMGGITIMPFHSRIRHQLEAMLEDENGDDDDDDDEEDDDDEDDEDDENDEESEDDEN
jgi:hypothetical protein